MDFQQIAETFIKDYYGAFDGNRALLKDVYRDHSMLTFERQPVGGVAAIMEKLVNLPFQQVIHRVDTLDAQPSAEDGIMIMVTGALQVEGQEKPMSFSQTFQIKYEPGSKKWYVLNDVFVLVYPAA
ncbi:putative nuclear transport factor 2 [Trematosphaeria pertusa]|uniref:Nuclear transport factor 2 n=1 Tax=Trematosphaeria pertusa TaxID=390896 RepID=A0A6A6I2Q4_9PLEO|nr:putative nuclear transport factor 2 [Trematosphaeria pertusa]KAF2244268.1 putative nuclear transport factor 2 [Trematosphaeria pertusa]